MPEVSVLGGVHPPVVSLCEDARAVERGVDGWSREGYQGVDTRWWAAEDLDEAGDDEDEPPVVGDAEYSEYAEDECELLVVERVEHGVVAEAECDEFVGEFVEDDARGDDGDGEPQVGGEP